MISMEIDAMIKITVMKEEFLVVSETIRPYRPEANNYVESWARCDNVYEMSLTSVRQALERLKFLENSLQAKVITHRELLSEIELFKRFTATYDCLGDEWGHGPDHAEQRLGTVTETHDLGRIVRETVEKMISKYLTFP